MQMAWLCNHNQPQRILELGTCPLGVTRTIAHANCAGGRPGQAAEAGTQGYVDVSAIMAAEGVFVDTDFGGGQR